MPEKRSQAHIGSLFVSAFFVIAGIVTLYDTASYTDRDSQVFPQAVAIILIITAGGSLIVRFLSPSDEGGFGNGVWWRRALLVLTMLITCFAMPYIGFLLAGMIAFAGGLIAAMHEHWSTRTLLVYWGSGVIILTAFFSIFKYVLHVPLP
ncbi:MAG: tripartite tricarboxylate transporter TctB family protein [Paracoccaceae bacterium]|nr:tripartite tricarboxylate transporter TctB family protein [Paracoccaceae bacterium]